MAKLVCFQATIANYGKHGVPDLLTVLTVLDL